MTHAELVFNLVKPGKEILLQLTPAHAHLWHMSSCVCGEAGELFDAVKKTVIYNKKLDLQNVVEELGDLEFYLEGVRQALGISREETIRANIDKLTIRYGDTYSDQAAQKRVDKEVN